MLVKISLFFYGVIFNLLPDRLILFMLDALMPLYPAIFPKTYKKYFLNNSVLYPQYTAAQLKATACLCVKINFFDEIVFVKYIIFKRIPKYKAKIVGYEKIKDYMGKKRMIIATSHVDFRMPSSYILIESNHLNLNNVPVITPIRWSPNLSHELKGEILKLISMKNVKFVPLGGAMPEIKKTINNEGIVILALDGIQKLNHMRTVKFLAHDFQMTTGHLWLAEKYNLPIFTMITLFDSKKMELTTYVEGPFVNVKANDDKLLQTIADKLQSVIIANPGHWNLVDDYYGLQKDLDNNYLKVLKQRSD